MEFVRNEIPNKKSLSGFLSKYANLDLIEKEGNAWFENIKEHKTRKTSQYQARA